MTSNSLMRHVAYGLLPLLALNLPLATAADDDNVLRLGLQKNEFKLMNALVRPWYDSANFFGVTHVPLVTFTPELNIAPCLAEDWEIAADGKSIVFHLVNNATWHDGLPVTAEDVAFSLEYWKKNQLYAQGYWYDSYLDHVDVIDDYTVEVVFKEPVAVASLITELATTSIIPEHVWSKVDAPRDYDGDDGMIGCGPFVFEKYDADAQVAYLKADPNYFAGKPSVDRIEWRYFRTLDSLLLALKNGEIDAMLDYYNPVPGSYAAGLGADVELGTVSDVGVPLHLVFGFRQYPTNQSEFREAVSYAIDCQTLVDAISAGYGTVPEKGYSSPALPGYRSDLPKLEYDPDKAKEILDDAGFKDLDGDGFRESPGGSKLRIPLTPYAQPHIIRAAEVIDSQLELVGLDVYVETLSSDAVSQKAWTDRDYYMMVGYSTPYGNLLADSASNYYVDLPGMYGTSTDPELIDLVESAIYSENMDELMEHRSEIQEYAAEELPIIALIWGDAIYPYRTDRWEGWVPMYGYGSVNYWTWFNLESVSG